MCPGQNQELLRVNRQLSFLNWPVAGYGLLDRGGVRIICSSHHKEKSRNPSLSLWHEPLQSTSPLLNPSQHVGAVQRRTSSSSANPPDGSRRAGTDQDTGALELGEKKNSNMENIYSILLNSVLLMRNHDNFHYLYRAFWYYQVTFSYRSSHH